MNSENTILDRNTINELIKLDSTGNGDFIREIIDLYISQLTVLKNEIQSSFYKNEFLKTSKTSHNLKGASLNLGAITLADICKKIENNIAENHPANIEELINQLDPISIITINELEEIKRNEIEK